MNTQKSRVGREHILEVAEQLFTKRGYQEVSIRAIAEASGVTNAALYYHFENKEALFIEVIKQHASRLGEYMRKAGEREGSYQERITAIAQTYMELMANRRSLPFLLRHELKNLGKEKPPVRPLAIFGRVFGPIEEILQEAAQSGELRQLPEGYSGTPILLGMLHGVGRHQRFLSQSDLTEENVRLIVDLFWNGMRRREE